MTDCARTEGAPERRAWILATLRSVGFLTIAELTKQLGVSHMTVRRDLRALERSAQVRLVHGGVSVAPSALARSAFPDDSHRAGRARVAGCAARLVEPGDTIAIDAGPTAYAIARALPRDFAGSVITHSMPVMQLLAEEAARSHLVALGGELLPGRRALVGPTTEAALSGLCARTLFLSPCSVDARGLYGCSAAEASVERRLMDIADQVVLVVTAEAFSSSAPALIRPLRHVSMLITDQTPPRELRAALAFEGVPVDVLDGGVPLPRASSSRHR